MVPQPGIGPGRPDWSRGCKPRLSANSSTGAQNTLNAGAVMLAKASPAPACFGPISAALLPSSSLNSSPNCLERNIVVADFVCVMRPSPGNRFSFLVCDFLDLPFLGQSRQNRMDRRGGVLLRSNIETQFFQILNYILRGHLRRFCFHDLRAGFRNPTSVRPWRFGTHRSQRRNRASKSCDLIVEAELLQRYLPQSLSRTIKRSSRFPQGSAKSFNLRIRHEGSIL